MMKNDKSGIDAAELVEDAVAREIGLIGVRNQLVVRSKHGVVEIRGQEIPDHGVV